MTCNYLDDEPGNEGAVLSPEHPTSEEEDCADKVVHGDDDGSDEKGADEAHGGPSDPPLQDTLLLLVAVTINTAGSVIV